MHAQKNVRAWRAAGRTTKDKLQPTTVFNTSRVNLPQRKKKGEMEKKTTLFVGEGKNYPFLFHNNKTSAVLMIGFVSDK